MTTIAFGTAAPNETRMRVTPSLRGGSRHLSEIGLAEVHEPEIDRDLLAVGSLRANFRRQRSDDAA